MAASELFPTQQSVWAVQEVFDLDIFDAALKQYTGKLKGALRGIRFWPVKLFSFWSCCVI